MTSASSSFSCSFSFSLATPTPTPVASACRLLADHQSSSERDCALREQAASIEWTGRCERKMGGAGCRVVSSIGNCGFSRDTSTWASWAYWAFLFFPRCFQILSGCCSYRLLVAAGAGCQLLHHRKGGRHVSTSRLTPTVGGAAAPPCRMESSASVPYGLLCVIATTLYGLCF